MWTTFFFSFFSSCWLLRSQSMGVGVLDGVVFLGGGGDLASRGQVYLAATAKLPNLATGLSEYFTPGHVKGRIIMGTTKWSKN